MLYPHRPLPPHALVRLTVLATQCLFVFRAWVHICACRIIYLFLWVSISVMSTVLQRPNNTTIRNQQAGNPLLQIYAQVVMLAALWRFTYFTVMVSYLGPHVNDCNWQNRQSVWTSIEIEPFVNHCCCFGYWLRAVWESEFFLVFMNIESMTLSAYGRSTCYGGLIVCRAKSVCRHKLRALSLYLSLSLRADLFILCPKPLRNEDYIYIFIYLSFETKFQILGKI